MECASQFLAFALWLHRQFSNRTRSEDRGPNRPTAVGAMVNADGAAHKPRCWRRLHTHHAPCVGLHWATKLLAHDCTGRRWFLLRALRDESLHGRRNTGSRGFNKTGNDLLACLDLEPLQRGGDAIDAAAGVAWPIARLPSTNRNGTLMPVCSLSLRGLHWLRPSNHLPMLPQITRMITA
jgi:hypothetical protein